MGLVESEEMSLRDYGFVCRSEKSDQYVCIYKLDNNKYEYGLLEESEIEELLTGKSWMRKKQISDFLKYCGQNLNNFIKLPFTHKAFTMIQFFGAEAIMGKTIDPMTLDQALEFMHSD
jgi:hypothetical protein